MFQFIKSNKMFTAVAAFAGILLVALCYGLAVHNVVAVVIGSAMLVAAISYSFVSSHKEAQTSK